MKSYLVFKTSVEAEKDIEILAPVLNKVSGEWNFDLDDCDRILRVGSDEIDHSTVEQLLQRAGFECAELGD